MNSTIEINGTHLVTDTIADAQCKRCHCGYSVVTFRRGLLNRVSLAVNLLLTGAARALIFIVSYTTGVLKIVTITFQHCSPIILYISLVS